MTTQEEALQQAQERAEREYPIVKHETSQLKKAILELDNEGNYWRRQGRSPIEGGKVFKRNEADRINN